jgi:hypothetical protein
MKSVLINLLFALVLVLSACSVKNDQIIARFEGNYSEKKWSIKELPLPLSVLNSTFMML